VTTRCDSLGAFYAGELSRAEADAMRDHLGGCERCQHELRQLMLESAVVADATGAPRRRRRRGVRIGMAITACAALAAAGLLWVRRPSPAPDRDAPQLVAELAPRRGVEVRFSDPDADRHRPYDVARGADRTTHEEISLEVLAALERAGDHRALCAAQALSGDLAKAARACAAVASGPAADSDRAALALLRGEPEVALTLVHTALPAAAGTAIEGMLQWNGALALRAMGLPLLAASWFDRVASRGEAGWAGEAATTRDQLRADHATRRASVKAAWSEAKRMVAERTPMALELVRRHPGFARGRLIDAILSAGSAAELRGLGDAATLLDERAGDHSLAEAIRRAQARLPARAALAARYARLVSAAGDDPRALSAALGPGDEDLAIAVRLLTEARGLPAPARAAPLAVLAERSGDRWLVLRVAELEARRLLYVERRFHAAEQRLRAALVACATPVFADRCGRLQALLAVVLAAQGRPELALPRLAIATTLAAEEDDWELGLMLLQSAAEVALVRRAPDIDPVLLAGAYLDELGLRTDDCASNVYRHDFLAIAAINQNQPEVAREHVAKATELTTGRCASVGPRINGVFAAAHVLQHGGRPAELAALREAIALARGRTSTVGERALLDHAEGRLLLEHDRAAGEARLRAAITATGATGDDVPLQRARTYSFTVLALEAGRRGEHGAALALLAEELGEPAPTRCTVGIVGEDRILVVAAGADGAIAGRYDDVPIGRPSLPAAGLVPPALSSTLAGCDRVVVLAKGAYYGLSRLLPASLAWSYRSPAAKGDRPGLPGTRLVVTGIEPPASLGLPSLRAEPDVEGAIVLRGPAATPRRVLDEAKRSATLEIHAHGLVDVSEPGAAALVLSPDARGDYALTAEAVAGIRLARHPVVILGACHAGSVPRSLEPWGLADAFLRAGARAVIASPATLPDADGAQALAAIAARVRGGEAPAAAVRAVRDQRRADWLEDLVIFE
jgi:hypothetical protein